MPELLRDVKVLLSDAFISDVMSDTLEVVYSLNRIFDLLSEASKTSLELQGGVLSRQECTKFEAQEYFKPSILLRKFDEAAKKTDIKMKSIHDYQKLLSSKLI